jgi:hypothetical protein
VSSDGAADAEREELVHRNVAKLVRPPNVSRDEARVLTSRRHVDWSALSAVTGSRRYGSVP